MIYDEVYLPALFQKWCPLVLEAAKTKSGHRVIDVACGTGALARELDHTGVKVWAEDDASGDDRVKLLLKTAEEELTSYRTAKVTVAFPTSAHIVTARR